jgi:hypothetical protein
MTSALDRLPLRTRLVAGTALLVAVGLLVAGVGATSRCAATSSTGSTASCRSGRQPGPVREDDDRGRRPGDRRGGVASAHRTAGRACIRALLGPDGAVVAASGVVVA